MSVSARFSPAAVEVLKLARAVGWRVTKGNGHGYRPIRRNHGRGRALVCPVCGAANEKVGYAFGFELDNPPPYTTRAGDANVAANLGLTALDVFTIVEAADHADSPYRAELCELLGVKDA